MDNWDKAKKIFGEAIKFAPDERRRFLDEVCADDADTRREVESLLASYDEAESFMENPAVGEVAEIIGKENFENEATKIFFANETSETGEEELPDGRDENALRPSRLRFALVCLVFVFVVSANVINLVQQFSLTNDMPEWKSVWRDTRRIITKVDASFADRMKIGDEIVSINNEPFNKKNYFIIRTRMKAGEQYTLQIKRDGEAARREVKLITQPLPFAHVLNLYILGIFLPTVFLLTGLAVFLFKPNDEQTILTSVLFALASFALVSMAIMPQNLSYYLELPVFFAVWWRAGQVAAHFSLAVLLHLFLVFPERSRFVRRFPNLEWLIYLPVTFSLIPSSALALLSYEGWTQFDFIFELTFLGPILSLIIALYLFAALAALLLNYLKTDETGKRRIRLIVVGFTLALIPVLLNYAVFTPISLLSVNLLPNLNDWQAIVFYAPSFLVPLTFGYAIVRHKVIPVSFVIRRGLQYLLAKNALRLLLVLPVLGIVWNIASNPNRTVYEILLNNSFAFYSFLALAAGFFLLIRSRLSEWIDRRFFREQYNQEKILRELTEVVKESDSLAKLSRLVSSKIQLALHPESIYLFFRDDALNSDFSLVYTTSGNSMAGLRLPTADLPVAAGQSAIRHPKSPIERLAADSPLLRFMQKERGTIEFPARQTDGLPNREKRWLRETGANLLVPMHGSDGKLAGIFSLGEKMSQIPYTTRDKELLETLANQIALVHENLNLKARMRHEQQIKTEVLSRFDEGNINLLKECPMCGRCFDRTVERCAADNAELTFSVPVERTIENRYRLEKLLGKGGMGAVYEATDLRINRQVAVKILSGAMFGNREALRRFEREAQTAGKLNHRNIVTVFDYGVLSTEGAFLVMELVKGNTLSEILKNKGKLEAATVVAWFGQVLDGVEVAHKAGIVHRDLKPDNIFVTHSEDKTVRLCILDFGLARFNEHEFADSVTVPGTIMGTLGYMPPEQLNGGKTDERSDLFATGVMIYEALHGKKPFAGKTYQEITRSMSKEITFDKDEPFANFFERGLVLKPEKRFASASEMKTDLLNSSFILQTN